MIHFYKWYSTTETTHRAIEKQTRHPNPSLTKELTLVPDMQNNLDKGTCTQKANCRSFTGRSVWLLEEISSCYRQERAEDPKASQCVCGRRNPSFSFSLQQIKIQEFP